MGIFKRTPEETALKKYGMTGKQLARSVARRAATFEQARFVEQHFLPMLDMELRSEQIPAPKNNLTATASKTFKPRYKSMKLSEGAGLYKKNAYLAAAVDAIRDACVSIPWYAGVMNEENKIDPIQDKGDALVMLMDKPNKYQSWGGLGGIIDFSVLREYLCGNYIIEKATDTIGVPRFLQHLNPDWITNTPSTVPGELNASYEYRIAGSSEKKIFDGYGKTGGPGPLIHGMFTDPENPNWGAPPILSCSDEIETMIAAAEWNEEQFEEQSKPNALLSVQSQMGDEDYAAARHFINREYKEANGGVLVVGDGATYTNMGRSAVEMDYVASIQALQETICTRLDVPPPVIQMLRNATYNNFETAWAMFYLKTVIKVLDSLAKVFTSQLAVHFGNDYAITYDVKGAPALFAVLKQKLDAIKNLQSSGLSFADAARIVGLVYDPFAGEDDRYVPVGSLPADQAGLGGGGV